MSDNVFSFAQMEKKHKDAEKQSENEREATKLRDSHPGSCWHTFRKFPA